MLDYILEDGRLAIEGISGASAGAINAVMVADGLARGGPDVARTRLADFWRAASIDGDLPNIQRKLLERLFTFVPLEGSPVAAWVDALSRYFSPYDLNPLNINPLKDVIERFVDFEAVRAFDKLQLFISATNVQDRAPQGFPAREDHRRRGDGLGLPAAAVQGGDDRRRALLGRRLSRQSRRSSRSSTRPIPKTC